MARLSTAFFRAAILWIAIIASILIAFTITLLATLCLFDGSTAYTIAVAIAFAVAINNILLIVLFQKKWPLIKKAINRPTEFDQ